MDREKDVEAYLVRQVEILDGICWKWGGVGVFGVPDRVVVWPNGVVHFVEVKTDTGKLTPLQAKRIMQLRGLHAKVFVVYGKAGVADYLTEHAPER